MEFNDDIFVIGSYINTKEKEDTVIKLINNLKKFNIPILLCGHYPIDINIQKLVDFYIYDSNNDVVTTKDFNKYNILDKIHFIETDDWRTEFHLTFIHDYAIWMNMKRSFNFVKLLGKKYIHYVEYDCYPDPDELVKEFMIPTRTYDASFLTIGNEFFTTLLFSSKIDVIVDFINKFDNKLEYFNNQYGTFVLENLFYRYFINNNITIYHSNYTLNSKEYYFNLFDIGGVKSGDIESVKIACTESNKLYGLIFQRLETEQISIKIEYDNYTQDISNSHSYVINNDHRVFIVYIGEYKKGEILKIIGDSIGVYNEHLNMDVDEYKKLKRITIKN